MNIRPWKFLPAILLLVVGVYLEIYSQSTDDPWAAYDRHCALIIIFGMSLGILLHAREKPMPSEYGGHVSLRAWAGLAAMAVILAGFTGVAGMMQFAGFDHSALIDIPWRMVNGQQPYVDFPCTLPVGFYLPAYYAFELGGVSWSSLVLINSFFAALTFLWTAWLLAHLFGANASAWMLAFCIQSCTTVLVGYWWYNPVTTVMGTIFILSGIAWLRNPTSRTIWLSWGGSLLLFATCKPNIAGPLIVGAVLVLAFDRKLRCRVLATALLAFVVFTLWLAAHGIFVTSMLGGYLSVASRGFSLGQFLQDLGPREKALSLSILGLVFAPLLLLIPRRCRPNRVQCLCVITLVCGLYGFATNGESKLVDLPLLLIASAVWMQEAARLVDPKPLTQKLIHPLYEIQSALVVALIVSGVGLGWLRHRVKLAGQGTFFEYGRLSNVSDVPFFAGMKTGPIFQVTVAEVLSLMKSHPVASVFFGPRMQWAYAATGRLAPEDQPSWWHPGVTYKIKDEVHYLQSWRKARHDVLVFIRGDYTYLTPDFMREILLHYNQENHQYITVYTTKNKPRTHPNQ